MTKNDAEKVNIQEVFSGLGDAWQNRDGKAWGDHFIQDADFTVWFGLHLKGRSEIAEGHQWVFDEVYPDTRYVLEIERYRFLDKDTAIVHLNGSIVNVGGSLPEEPHSLPVAVLKNIDGEWKIVMFHNMKNQRKKLQIRREHGDMGDIRA